MFFVVIQTCLGLILCKPTKNTTEIKRTDLNGRHSGQETVGFFRVTTPSGSGNFPLSFSFSDEPERVTVIKEE